MSVRLYQPVTSPIQDPEGAWTNQLYSLLRLSDDPGQAFQLLDLLQSLDADEAVLDWALERCKRCKSTGPVIAEVAQLVEELVSVTSERPSEEISIDGHQLRCRPRIKGDQVGLGPWYLADAPFLDSEVDL